MTPSTAPAVYPPRPSPQREQQREEEDALERARRLVREARECLALTTKRNQKHGV